MPHVELDGQRIFYSETGLGDDVIVFSHGYLMDHTMFDAQVRALEDRWRCIVWDERGHGQTETTDAPFTYWDSARDLIGLLDHLGVQRAVLTGMSQGGFLSLRAALTAPERVRAVVLIDSQPGVEDPAKVPIYDQLMDAWMAPEGPPSEVIDTVAAIVIGPGFSDTPRWQERWLAMPKAKVRQAYTTLMTREDDVAPRLAELTMPVLVIHGAQDVAIDPEIARGVAAALPDGRLVVVDGAGHGANLTHPEAVNAALEDFLTRV